MFVQVAPKGSHKPGNQKVVAVHHTVVSVVASRQAKNGEYLHLRPSYLIAVCSFLSLTKQNFVI